MVPVNRLRRLLARQGGYTVIEMVSVIAIISVLSGLVIANTSTGNKRQELRDTVAGYVAAAKQAEGLAASAQSIPPADPAQASFPRTAYGVCITSSAINNPRCDAVSNAATQPLDTYQIYARKNGDTNYTIRPNNPDIISTIKASRNVIFTSQSVWIDYLPPGPDLVAIGSTAQQTVSAQVIGQNGYIRNAVIKPKAGAVYVQ
jgi:prepilin-type N-terminal cleavage/methylation domain-containing protein